VESVVTAVVFRFDPALDAMPRYREYRLPVLGSINVLRLLSRIHDELDPTLSVRDYCCGLQLCRSCVLKIDHVRRVSCHTLVAPGETVRIEPLEFPERHVKDLVNAG
jgi:succinate dehydrogenase/fumarate reductase-like Fe-S protein